MKTVAIAQNVIGDQFQAPEVHKALAILTSRQRTFVLGIMLRGLSSHAAAKEAGYSSGNQAYVLMRNPNVIQALRIMQLEYAQKLEVGMEEVKEGMLDAIEVARATNNAMAMIAGWREIGKLVGAYKAEEKNININIHDMDAIKELPTHRLYELAGPKLIEGIEDEVYVEEEED